MADFGDGLALDYALRSRDTHGVRIGGRCDHCRTDWPCSGFWIAHHVVVRLSEPATDQST